MNVKNFTGVFVDTLSLINASNILTKINSVGIPSFYRNEPAKYIFNTALMVLDSLILFEKLYVLEDTLNFDKKGIYILDDVGDLLNTINFSKESEEKAKSYLLNNELEGKINSNTIKRYSEDIKTVRLFFELGLRDYNGIIFPKERYYDEFLKFLQVKDKNELSKITKLDKKSVEYFITVFYHKFRTIVYAEESRRKNLSYIPQEFRQKLYLKSYNSFKHKLRKTLAEKLNSKVKFYEREEFVDFPSISFHLISKCGDWKCLLKEIKELRKRLREEGFYSYIKKVDEKIQEGKLDCDKEIKKIEDILNIIFNEDYPKFKYKAIASILGILGKLARFNISEEDVEIIRKFTLYRDTRYFVWIKNIK